MTTAAVQGPSSRAASMVGTRTESDWTARAACRDTDPDELFVQGAAQNRAKTRCFGCVVRTECLADALDNRVEFGVWGGMTERERRALLRRRPDVLSWRVLLETARAEALGRASGTAAVGSAAQPAARKVPGPLGELVSDSAQAIQVMDISRIAP